MRVRVRSPVSEFEFDVHPKTPVREIFVTCAKNGLIIEIWYFGLMYWGPHQEQFWIDTSKKTIKDIPSSKPFEFKIKYFPEDVTEELIEKSTIEVFFAQIRRDIVQELIYCPPDTCVVLASYALQAKYGDCSKNEKQELPVATTKLLPERIIKQHEMSETSWEDAIKKLWSKHKGLDSEDAMLEYLKLSQNLEMYGVTFFEIRNRKGTDLLLGVNALGLDIYTLEDKLNPQISFPWSEIKRLHFKDRKFIIKPTDKSANDFIFFTDTAKISKTILQLGVGNHGLYMRRRKPDSPDIARMKERAKKQREARLNQKDKLSREKAAREEVEKREMEYQATIKSMQEELTRKAQSLQEAQNTIKRLQEQLEELQRAKEELEKQQQELREMMERLEHNKNLEAADKQALEDEIRAKQLEVQRIQEEVEAKDEETRRLQAEVEEARRREEEFERAEEERKRRELEEAARRQADELEALPEGANTALPEVAEVNEQLQEQLKILQDQLNKAKNKELETDLDKIHRINLRQGRDKYKTLADIRRGNTSRRVELFENL